MSDARPLLSIIIPSFNQGSYIRETIESTLAQDYRPIEVLVFDGGSRDSTLDVLHSFDHVPELQWWSEADRGVVEAVNKGLARVRGDIVAIQSSDDTYVPGAFTAIVDAFERHPEAGLIYGDIHYINADSIVTSTTALEPFDLLNYIGKLIYIPQPAAFFRREIGTRAGAWREEISYAADAEFFLRIALESPVVKIDRVVAGYRYHDAQRDKAGARIIRDWEQAMQPYVRSPDRAIRRYARSGVDVVRIHYTSETHWARRTWWRYRAIATNPALWHRREVVRDREMLPGHFPIMGILSCLKQALGFRPRGS